MMVRVVLVRVLTEASCLGGGGGGGEGGRVVLGASCPVSSESYQVS